ncbi:unnamed protein product [Hymenolepis diminuta]|uniref:Cytochrome c oxidase assembly protein COX16, mitochondrial n=1 Tax=Hymenolepis diminuta TaxID=6216 RepID=A0A0R3SB51_HYMDI|nr:unnamed protein product [Hymenolepis diminuta]
MQNRPRVYRPSVLSRVRDYTFKTFALASFLGGAAVTGYVIIKLGKYYIFDRKNYKLQRKQYAEALIEKEKREKELGLRD